MKSDCNLQFWMAWSAIKPSKPIENWDIFNVICKAGIFSKKKWYIFSKGEIYAKTTISWWTYLVAGFDEILFYVFLTKVKASATQQMRTVLSEECCLLQKLCSSFVAAGKGRSQIRSQWQDSGNSICDHGFQQYNSFFSFFPKCEFTCCFHNCVCPALLHAHAPSPWVLCAVLDTTM